jgi:hypothetical protein
MQQSIKNKIKRENGTVKEENEDLTTEEREKAFSPPWFLRESDFLLRFRLRFRERERARD